MSLHRVERFRVPARLVSGTEGALRQAGAKGRELFVLWCGRVDGPLFDVTTAQVPRQTAYSLDTGLCVRVEGDELHRLNMWLYDTGLVLGAQVHAHPTDAYHSETDDTYPIVSAPGALSIVAPDFCRRGLLVDDAALYRLDPPGWAEATTASVQVA